MSLTRFMLLKAPNRQGFIKTKRFHQWIDFRTFHSISCFFRNDFFFNFHLKVSVRNNKRPLINDAFELIIGVSTCLHNLRPQFASRPDFLSQWEQSKVLTPYFLCLHVFKFQTFLSQKRPNFLSQWEQSKVLTIYFFVFKCAHEDSLWTEKNDLTGNWHSTSEYFYAMCAYEDSLWTNIF